MDDHVQVNPEQKAAGSSDDLRAAANELTILASKEGIAEDDPLGMLFVAIQKFGLSLASQNDDLRNEMDRDLFLMRQSVNEMAAKLSEFKKTAETIITRGENDIDDRIRTYQLRLEAMYVSGEQFRDRVVEEFMIIIRENVTKLRDESLKYQQVFRVVLNVWDRAMWFLVGGAVCSVVLLVLGKV